MPVIRTKYGWGLYGMPGQGGPYGYGGLGGTEVSASTYSSYGFMDGLQIWMAGGSAITGAFSNLGTLFSSSPQAALGFLSPILGVGLLLLAGMGGGSVAAGRKRRNPARARRRRGRGGGPRRKRNREGRDRYSVQVWDRGGAAIAYAYAATLGGARGKAARLRARYPGSRVVVYDSGQGRIVGQSQAAGRRRSPARH
jgi:hypothetical protein